MTRNGPDVWPDRPVGHATRVRQPTPEPPDDATHTMADGWMRLTEQVDRANAMIAGSGTDAAWQGWRTQTVGVLDSLVRRSIELRLVATTIDDGR